MMERQPADVVLLDIELTDGNGLDFLLKLKRCWPDVPVVMLTGLGYDETLVRHALKNGASGYVSKGVGMENVVVKVKQALRSESGKRAVMEAQ